MTGKNLSAGSPGRGLWIFVLVPVWAGAPASDDLLPDQSGPLIPAYQGSLRMESPGARAEAERCGELSRRIRELEGKPLRQSKVVEEYEAECQEGGAAAEPRVDGLQ